MESLGSCSILGMPRRGATAGAPPGSSGLPPRTAPPRRVHPSVLALRLRGLAVRAALTLLGAAAPLFARLARTRAAPR
jgi:hypothetical protein